MDRACDSFDRTLCPSVGLLVAQAPQSLTFNLASLWDSLFLGNWTHDLNLASYTLEAFLFAVTLLQLGTESQYITPCWLKLPFRVLKNVTSWFWPSYRYFLSICHAWRPFLIHLNLDFSRSTLLVSNVLHWFLQAPTHSFERWIAHVIHSIGHSVRLSVYWSHRHLNL